MRKRYTPEVEKKAPLTPLLKLVYKQNGIFMSFCSFSMHLIHKFDLKLRYGKMEPFKTFSLWFDNASKFHMLPCLDKIEYHYFQNAIFASSGKISMAQIFFIAQKIPMFSKNKMLAKNLGS